MIITPDFLDHWKTKLLIQLLDDPEAPCSLIRLWSHCQNRKAYRFTPDKMNPAILKAISQSRATPNALWSAFIESGFLCLHEDGSIEAYGFYDANAQLVSNWENGKKGGRPPKEKPIGKPTQTHPEPTGGMKIGREEKEKIEKQEESEEEESFSPAPRKQAFWYGKDYSKTEVPEIRNYENIRRIQDPIEACMAVSGDRSKGMYGFLVKGLQKSMDAGLSEGTLKEHLFDLCARLFGEQRAGERSPEKIAPALIAEMRDFFETVDRPATQHKGKL